MELAIALCFLGAELIMIPVSPGMMKPPKNSESQNRNKNVSLLSTNGIGRETTAPITPIYNISLIAFGWSYPPNIAVRPPPTIHPSVGAVNDIIEKAGNTIDSFIFNASRI